MTQRHDTIRIVAYNEESIIGTNLELTVHQLKQSCSPQVKELIISIKDA